MQQNFGAQGLDVWSVTSSPAPAALSFVDDLPESWLTMAGAEDAFSNFSIWATPQVYLINPANEIVADNLTSANAVLERELAVGTGP